jgi:mRNA interferase MazF
MAVSRGDVILTHVRFSSGAGGKVRPALIVQSNYNNQRLQDTIVALITRTTHRSQIEATQQLVDISTTDGKASGLLQTSAVKCEHLETILQADIQRTIGHLPATPMKKIDDCLRAALELS